MSETVERKKITIGAAKFESKPEVPRAVDILGRELTTEEAGKIFRERREELRKRDSRYIRALIIGTKGSGKTYSAIRTLPRPILFLVFDPDADRIVSQRDLDNGEVLIVQYYGDDPSKPTGYSRYEKDMEAWKANGFLNHFASIVVDGLSTMQQIKLREIAYDEINSGRGRVGRTLTPDWKDYNVLRGDTMLGFMSLCSANAHFVLTAHIAEDRYYEDEKQTMMRIHRYLNTTPAMQISIPALFSEVYIAECVINNNAKDKKDKVKYIWKTMNSEDYKGIRIVTRFNCDGELVNEVEPQDFRALLKKTGCFYEDKPFFSMEQSIEKNEEIAQ